MEAIIHDIPATVGRIYIAEAGVFDWGGKYVMVGAIIVVPVCILINLANIKDKFKRKN